MTTKQRDINHVYPQRKLNAASRKVHVKKPSAAVAPELRTVVPVSTLVPIQNEIDGKDWRIYAWSTPPPSYANFTPSTSNLSHWNIFVLL